MSERRSPPGEGPIRVLVTHPGRQHSHQEALALARSGLLAGYWSGVPSVAEHLAGLRGRLLGRFVRYRPVPLDPATARWVAFPPVLRRAGDTLLPRRLAQRADLLACRVFDRWAARRLPAGIDAVIACEISARDTFHAARGRGAATLLDAPSFHHQAQDRLHGFGESPALHRRIVAVKDEEIALADHVLVVSEVARATYLEAGVPPGKVHAIPLGADTDLFTPPEEPPSGPVTFLFAGASIRRKGFDLLVDAFAAVREQAPEAVLRLVGPRGELAPLADGHPGVIAIGTVPQPALAEELRGADCLVLPSRNDSYGMVVAEALASGTPVLVTDMVGAKDLVAEGRSGWVVPAGDAAALTRRMLWCAENPEPLRAMRPAARQAAEHATWDAYHQRFAAVVEELVGQGAGA